MSKIMCFKCDMNFRVQKPRFRLDSKSYQTERLVCPDCHRRFWTGVSGSGKYVHVGIDPANLAEWGSCSWEWCS